MILGKDVKKLIQNTKEFCAAITRAQTKKLEPINEIDEPEIPKVQILAKVRPEPQLTPVMEGDLKYNPTDEKEIELEKHSLFKLESLKGTSRQEFIDAQQSDPSLSRVRKAIGTYSAPAKTNRSNATHYYKSNDIIYRKFYFGPSDKLGSISSVKQLVVPQQYHRSILSVAHDEPLASHVGIAKTKHK